MGIVSLDTNMMKGSSLKLDNPNLEIPPYCQNAVRGAH